MKFFYYLFKEKDNRVIFLSLVILFSTFYIILNKDLVLFISNLGDVNNPFFTELFKVNLFNFDPTLYYFGSISLIHPFYSIIVNSIGGLANKFGGNILILFINSIINSLGVAFIYIFFIKNNISKINAYLLSILYGSISYNMITSFIPDSYVYAQFIIIVSIIYIFYMRDIECFKVGGSTILSILNFGITITNIIPFSISLLLGQDKKDIKKNSHEIKLTLALFIFFIICITYFQEYRHDNNWITNIFKDVNAGGLAYAKMFDFNENSQILRLMFISPILLPIVKIVDFSSMAVVTDLSKNLSILSIIISLTLLGIGIYSIFKNIKVPIMRCLLTYFIWNIILHIILGFGLRDYVYDMYLYAGHYISVIFMIIGLAFSNIKSIIFKYIVSIIQILMISYILFNNICGTFKLLEFLKEIYT